MLRLSPSGYRQIVGHALDGLPDNDQKGIQVRISSNLGNGGFQQIDNVLIAARLHQVAPLRELILNELLAFADLTLLFCERFKLLQGAVFREVAQTFFGFGAFFFSFCSRAFLASSATGSPVCCEESCCDELCCRA